MPDRRLIINADDYGLCAEVDEAVEELVLAGRLGSVSVLANGGDVDRAIRFLLAHPRVGAGVHLNVVEGRPVSTAAELEVVLDRQGRFPGMPALLQRWVVRPREVARAVAIEWRAQIDRLGAAGISPDHLDSHQHLHAFPPFFAIAVALGREFGIHAMRAPRETSRGTHRLGGLMALRASLFCSRRAASTEGFRFNDHFLGFQRAGRYSLPTLLADLATLPPGLTELALHPSVQDHSPYPHYYGNAEREALLDPVFWRGILEQNLKPVTWSNSYLE